MENLSLGITHAAFRIEKKIQLRAVILTEPNYICTLGYTNLYNFRFGYKVVNECITRNVLCTIIVPWLVRIKFQLDKNVTGPFN